MVLKYVFQYNPSENKRKRKRLGSCKKFYRSPCKSRPAQIATKRGTTRIYTILTATDNKKNYTYSPNSDSFDIGIDTHASYTMSNDRRHFIGPIRPTRASIVIGVNGSLPIKGTGTVKWSITDDRGKNHIFRIPDTLYVPGIKTSMLSPQHWAKQMEQGSGMTAWEETKSGHSTLCWNNGENRRTVPLHSHTNTPIFKSSIGTKNYQVFEAVFNTMHQPRCVTCSTSIVDTSTADRTHEQNLLDIIEDNSITRSEFKILQSIDDNNLRMNDPQAELLWWHHRLGHAPFKTVRLLAAANILPRHLLNAKIPKCSACQYGAMTRHPWRGKAKPSKIKPTIIRGPGDCVSVDQIESSLPGFMAQLKGRLTKKRYNYATVFVDHYSRLKYVHLQGSITSEETLEAKIAFESYAKKHGVTVSHYHADNGRFADKLFLEHLGNSNQSITYCGVNAHFQNGIAEKVIRDLQEQARKQLLHAKARWPEVIHLSLWPYALRNSAYIYNLMPSQANGSSPLELFARTEIAPNLRQLHTFGCPVYTLHNSLQSGR